MLCSRPFRALPGLLCVLVLCLAGPAPLRAGPEADGKRKLERYPASFSLAVKKAIADGVDVLRSLQKPEGHWGDPAHDQAMGHTALPLLAMLKAGVPAADDAVQRAFAALRPMQLQRVYSVALYMMAIHAAYAPHVDTLDTEVGSDRHGRVQPDETHKQLSDVDRKAMSDGLGFLLRAQNASGLWHYGEPGETSTTAHDLSNSQYGLLGLRAAMDSGFDVERKVWQTALRALLEHQDVKGEGLDLLDHRVKDGYVFDSKEPAEVRGFHYTTARKNGPLGENTVWSNPATGSMTTAGVACVAICQEGLWRSRAFKGADRRRSRDAVRDGLAWMQEQFTVTENPGHPAKAHHRYYLYGLERMGMLTGHRWIGRHDWYKEGADLLLATQDPSFGGWGDQVETSFGILFLKRATRGARTVVVTGD